MTIERVRTGSHWDETLGCARAVAAGDRVLVAGTMPLIEDIVQGLGDPYEQTKAALAIALEALRPFGLDAGAVLRTRVYLTHLRDVDEAGRAHNEVFAEAPPITTMLVVSALADPRVLVEVELEAFRAPSDETAFREA